MGKPKDARAAKGEAGNGAGRAKAGKGSKGVAKSGAGVQRWTASKAKPTLVAREECSDLPTGFGLRTKVHVPPVGHGRKADKGNAKPSTNHSAQLVSKRNELKSSLKVGDNVFVLAAETEDWAYNIARITFIPKDRKMVHVVWYYRPEDLESCGRKAFHGDQELLHSDHKDVVPVESIEGTCQVRALRAHARTKPLVPWDSPTSHARNTRTQVHTLKAYVERGKKEDLDFDYDYYARFTYHTKTGKMSPEHVHVFCSCNMPVNPDLLMLSCDTCKDWFHPHCIGMKDSEAQKWQGPYVCPECVKKTR